VTSVPVLPCARIIEIRFKGLSRCHQDSQLYSSPSRYSLPLF